MKKILFLSLSLAIANLGLAQQTIVVNPNPVVNAGPDLILLPDIKPIQTQASVDDPLAVIQWVGPEGFASSVLNPWISILGAYTLTATNIYGCSSSDQMLLREANLGDDLFILPRWVCFGENRLVLFEYTSKIEGTFSGPGVIGNYFYPDSAGVGKHTIVWHTAEGIKIPSEVSILPGPDVKVDRDRLFGCASGSVTLSADGHADYYFWSQVDKEDTLSNKQYYSVPVGDSITSYQLIAGKIYTEYDKVCYTRNTTTVYPIKASFTYEQENREGQYNQILGSKITFTPDFLYGDSYSWNFGDKYVSGGGNSEEKVPTYNYQYVGRYKVTLTMNSICGISTAEKVVTVTSVVSSKINELNTFKVYPNPAKTYVKLEFGELQVERIYVVDVSGREMLVQQVYSDMTEVDVSTFKSGLYFVKIVDKQGNVSSAKFIKQ